MNYRRPALLALTAITALGLTACSTPSTAPSTSESAASTVEAGPRVAISSEGMITVLDGTTLDTLGTFTTEEFTRLNPAGDGDHVMVTMSEGFQVLTTGATDGAAPELTDLVFPADTPGHVVLHADKTVLYADGTSDTTIIDDSALAAATDELPETETIPGIQAHHGVSVVLEDGTLLTTVGGPDGRTGITALDASGTEIASSDVCPGVHGEGTAMNEAVVFGCDDGALVYSDGEITKLTAPDQPYGRMGNVFTTSTSPLIVGDYKNDPDAEGYLLEAVTVIDTEAKTYEVIAMPEGAAYTFRDIARGPEDLAYVLASDGAIHVLDPETGEFVDAFDVIDAWEGPAEWQDAHPSIKVSGDIAYVTEPAANAVHAIDLTTGEIVATTTLDVTPNEIAVAAG